MMVNTALPEDLVAMGAFYYIDDALQGRCEAIGIEDTRMAENVEMSMLRDPKRGWRMAESTAHIATTSFTYLRPRLVLSQSLNSTAFPPSISFASLRRTTASMALMPLGMAV